MNSLAQSTRIPYSHAHACIRWTLYSPYTRVPRRVRLYRFYSLPISGIEGNVQFGCLSTLFSIVSPLPIFKTGIVPLPSSPVLFYIAKCCLNNSFAIRPSCSLSLRHYCLLYLFNAHIVVCSQSRTQFGLSIIRASTGYSLFTYLRHFLDWLPTFLAILSKHVQVRSTPYFVSTPLTIRTILCSRWRSQYFDLFYLLEVPRHLAHFSPSFPCVATAIQTLAVLRVAPCMVILFV